MRKLPLFLAAWVCGLMASPVDAQPAPRKVDLALAEALSAGCAAEHVIIRTRPGFRAGLAEVLRTQRNQDPLEHPSISSVTAQVACEDIETLDTFDEVVSISMDAPVLPAGQKAQSITRAGLNASRKEPGGRKLPPLEQPRFNPREAPTVSKADKSERFDVPVSDARDLEGRAAAATQAWLGETLGLSLGGGADLPAYAGAKARGGIGVAVIDSGIQPAADFNGRITHFYDFTTGRIRRTNPTDGYGHGTHIAGLIGSRYVGVAPNARLVGLRVLNNAGRGRTSDVIQAIEFATANQAALDIQLINLSLGHPVYEPAATDPLVQAVEAAVRSGLVVIAAAGNFGINPATGEPGYAGIMSPGNAPSAITVGALMTRGTPGRGDDEVAPYSSRGPSWNDGYAKPDVLAPGHNLLSVAASRSHLRRQHELLGGHGEYMRLSGTSMAAGVTSGLAAAVLAAKPTLSPNALKMALQFTAIPLTGVDALTQGTGGINGQGALDLAGAINTDTPYGRKWLDGFTSQSLIAGEYLDWAGEVIWDGYRVQGDGVASYNHGVWDRNIVWGTFRPEWDNIVWGTVFGRTPEADNIVWGTFFGFAEADNIVWGTNFIWREAFGENDNIVWGTWFEDDNIVWGTNIVWGSSLIGVQIGEGDNIVWGTDVEWDNIVWGTWFEADNIVWGTLYDFNIVRGASRRPNLDFNIVWGSWRSGLEGDNIVWGTVRGGLESDNIVWGTSVMWGDTYIVGARPKGPERR